MAKTTQEIALFLKSMFSERSGGDRRALYKINKEELRAITGRRKLSRELIGELAEAVFDNGLTMIDCGSFFSIIRGRELESVTVSVDRGGEEKTTRRGPGGDLEKLSV